MIKNIIQEALPNDLEIIFFKPLFPWPNTLNAHAVSKFI